MEKILQGLKGLLSSEKVCHMDTNAVDKDFHDSAPSLGSMRHLKHNLAKCNTPYYVIDSLNIWARERN